MDDLSPATVRFIGVADLLAYGRRKEPQGIAFNAVLLILAAVVAWGRFGPVRTLMREPSDAARSLEEWNLRREQFRHPWQTDDPK